MPVRGRAPTRVDLVTLALYLSEGDSKLVDTEDVASKAHELDARFFRWRTREDQINLELVRVALSDAKKNRFAWVEGSGRAGWFGCGRCCLQETFLRDRLCRVCIRAREPLYRAGPGQASFRCLVRCPGGFESRSGCRRRTVSMNLVKADLQDLRIPENGRWTKSDPA